MQYKTLNDAAQLHQGLAEGSVEIWYMRPESSRTFSAGARLLKEMGNVPTYDTLGYTHVLLGSIKETDKNKISVVMQGENWSPNGEARQLILDKGLTHTSLMMGDIVYMNNVMYLVDFIGYSELS